MLCDTGPIVGMLVHSDPHHATCLEIAERLVEEELITTCACITESMHLLKRAGGWSAQEKLWELIESGSLRIHALPPISYSRFAQLMKKYRDAPMDFADASLVVAAEQLNQKRVFTLDAHFRIYRINDHIPFDVVQ